jgi:hypothetical protein
MTIEQTFSEQAREIAARCGISMTRARRAVVLGEDVEAAEFAQRNRLARRRQWHTAPDGSNCCCRGPRHECGWDGHTEYLPAGADE